MDFPEGGWRAWATVAGSFLFNFCGFGYTMSFGVYQAYYVEHYITNQSTSTISWIGSVNSFLMISGGVIVGRLFDKGYFYHLITIGSLLYCFSLFMLSLAQPDNFYQIFLTQGLGMGIGAGIIYVPTVAVVSHYFLRYRVIAMTIAVSGTSLGAVIHPIMMNKLLNSNMSFGNAVRISAGMVTGLLIIASMLMRTRLPPPKRLIPLGEAVKKFSRDRAYVFAALGLLVFTMAFYYPLFYIQLDATAHGLSQTNSFYSVKFLVILNASSFFGRILPGFFAQTLGVHNMITVADMGCTVLIFGMIGLRNLGGFIAVEIFYGFFAGTFVGLMGPLMALLSDDVSELGARMGIGFLFSGTPISGALLSTQDIWWKPALFSGVSNCSSHLMAIFY
ncbi:hypothetical protein SERLADRAFT_368118 [Serpula lacrymans var. lacrymans S7.9]|uniref:Major facilitator superfamily (MFS) profile domain-containing protein n=1 Tax=Serpula lacrymans var. lacrymans (strain S7.9) TaxID=578457 RepID=F8NQ95_SERL9|nr:uncharacterized protein SERLADRAFT_368118 [Serpula lacrymans var. lacrymans S7.9]EGO26555.1 hypothetical protein SERLADRAFT_368118 [Serpula lacrymans var. lacrymans S7.9]